MGGSISNEVCSPGPDRQKRREKAPGEMDQVCRDHAEHVASNGFCSSGFARIRGLWNRTVDCSWRWVHVFLQGAGCLGLLASNGGLPVTRGLSRGVRKPFRRVEKPSRFFEPAAFRSVLQSSWGGVFRYSSLMEQANFTACAHGEHGLDALLRAFLQVCRGEAGPCRCLLGALFVERVGGLDEIRWMPSFVNGTEQIGMSGKAH